MSLNPSTGTTGSSDRRWWHRWSKPIAFGVALLGALAVGYVILLLPSISVGWGLDYLAYHNAALRLAAGGSPYQPETLDQPFFPGAPGLYLYSPMLAALIMPFATMGADVAVPFWLALQLVALTLACALMPVSLTVRLTSFGIACLSWPVLFDLKLGNVNTFVALLAVVAWRWLDRPAASVAIAISVFVRPTMAVIAVWWALRRKWRRLMWAGLTTLAIVAVLLPAVSLGVWSDYATVVGNMSDVGTALQNTHFAASAVVLGAPEWLARLILPATYLAAISAILLSLRRDVELSFIVTTSATLLISPLMWPYYLVLLLLPAAFLASRGRPWALGLPLLGWLPTPVLPFVAIVGVLMPFLAKPLPGTIGERHALARPTRDLDSSAQAA